MSNITGKNILLGISGGIAAYKTPFLIRELIKKGHKVKVVASENALQFVTPITLQTVSNNPVYSNMFLPYQEDTTQHISLTSWADIFILAPATADIIGKYAHGITDDALSTSLLAFDKQVFICPAMNDAMYRNKTVQNNLKTLTDNGAEIIDAQEGFLACGTVGKGRMADIDIIVDTICRYFNAKQYFAGKKVTITAGPTREKIDSVRFISNNSSGKMGLAIAEQFIMQGAEVDLILGPVNIAVSQHDRLNIINVVSAQQMYEATLKSYPSSDIIVCAAAVADYTPDHCHEGKMKKKEADLCLNLVPTKDILGEIGKQKKASQILVGFALETDNEIENAKAKLQKKNLDFIVLNSLNDKGAGFEVNTNKVTVIDKRGNIFPMPLKDKKEVASDIVNMIKEFF